LKFLGGASKNFGTAAVVAWVTPLAKWDLNRSLGMGYDLHSLFLRSPHTMWLRFTLQNAVF